jgi:lipopolysaccharide export system protein LptA
VYFVDEERAELEGEVKITQGENQLDGNYAEVNMATGISKLLGARPGSAGQPTQVKALVLPRASKDEEAGDEVPGADEGAPAPDAGDSGS